MNIRLDIAAAYPSSEVCFNVSRETTKKEIINVIGVDEYTYRMQGINLPLGIPGAIEWCSTMLKFPTMFVLLDDYIKSKKNIIN